MSFLGICAKARPAFLLKVKVSLLTCPAHSKPASAQLSALSRMKILQIVNPAQVTTKRQILFDPSERKTLASSRNNWDKVSTDFDLVYESNLKNWIWGMYVSQAAVAATCSWLAIYKLSILLNVMSERDIQLMLACCGLFTISIIYFNFIATRTCIRLYHNSQSGQFIAVWRTFVGRLRKICYTPSDVTMCNQQSDDKDMKILIKVKGKKLQLLSSDFESMEYFNMHFNDAKYRQ